jgi:hypothetical protein
VFERTKPGERAAWHESTILIERADVPESTGQVERAILDEAIASSENLLPWLCF